nr:MAG TPA: hypothetical protein [Caudoviricetes sp.]
MNETKSKKKKQQHKHIIECYDDIYLPITFIILITTILAYIDTIYSQGYTIPY